jgi:hypothetical protein
MNILRTVHEKIIHSAQIWSEPVNLEQLEKQRWRSAGRVKGNSRGALYVSWPNHVDQDSFILWTVTRRVDRRPPRNRIPDPTM